MSIRNPRAVYLLVAATMTAISCSGADEQLLPVGGKVDGGAQASPPPPPPVDAGIDVAAPEVVPPGPWKRTVTLRNPLGGPSGNLLADGDFEMSTVPEWIQPQLGWRAYGKFGQEVNAKTETGGLCRTGLRCGVLEDGVALLARGAAAGGGAGNIASLWVKVLSQESCDVVTAYIVGCDTFTAIEELVADEEPNADGWCKHEGKTGPKNIALCLFVESDLANNDTALVDSGILVPDDGTISAKSTKFVVPTADLLQRTNAIRDRNRRTLPLGGSPNRVMSPLRPNR